MNNYKVKVEWMEKMSTEVDIKANSMGEAHEKLTNNMKHYLLHAKCKNVEDVYINKTTFVEINQDKVIDVDYTSQWDNEYITTDAKYSIINGIIFDIKPADDFELSAVNNCNLIREYISIEDNELSVIQAYNTIIKENMFVTKTFVENNLKEALNINNCNIELIYNSEKGQAYINYKYHNMDVIDDIVYSINSEDAWNELVSLFRKYGCDICGDYC